MKKKVFLMLTMLTMLIAPQQIFATEPTLTEIANKNPEMPARVKVLYARLDEIKKMDKSELTKVERKELRKEVRDIRTELRTTNNGIYLSVGAIIIIILLLILIL